ncbi:MAG: phosphotransferase, partial [Pseudomonadales bacterium]|nr:phosphotransferase [Pseudomonadales bacterium]
VKLRDFVYGPALEPAIDKFEGHFTPRQKEICRKVGEQYVELIERVSPSYTFLHGDYRQDNFIYLRGGDEAVTMDWQISGKGRAAFDVTYFVCQSLQSDLRRRIEKDLVRKYVERLNDSGVSGYDFETAWNDYRVLTLFCLIYPITVCGSLDLANERGRALAECMLDRNLGVIDDLGCDEFLG